MSTEERLAELKAKHEMLTERHNALVESIELWIFEGRERDRIWSQRFAGVADSIERLARIAELHQHRLDSHDDRLDELE